MRATSKRDASAADEAELVAAVLEKDRKAAAEFVGRYSDAVYSYIRHRLSPRTDLVEDLVQEVFLAAWSSLGAFQGHSSLRNWLLGIARHKVEDYYRARLRELAVISEPEDHAPPRAAADPQPDELLGRRQTQSRAREVLDGLPENLRLVLLWRYWEKRTVREIAGQTGKTEKAIERLVSRAREQFRRRWCNAEAPGR